MNMDDLKFFCVHKSMHMLCAQLAPQFVNAAYLILTHMKCLTQARV